MQTNEHIAYSVIYKDILYEFIYVLEPSDPQVTELKIKLYHVIEPDEFNGFGLITGNYQDLRDNLMLFIDYQLIPQINAGFLILENIIKAPNAWEYTQRCASFGD